MFQRRYNCNDGFFDSIDSEHSAYWLGFLAADGYIRRNAVELCLSSRDRGHLLAFKRNVDCEAPILDSSPAGYCDRSRLRFTSPRIVTALAPHGIVQRKTHTLQWPSHLPHHLTHQFLRGYVDGDGGFYLLPDGRNPTLKKHLSFSVAGTEPFLLGAQRYLVEAAGVSRVKLARKESPYILAYHRVMATHVYDLLYRRATVYLTRKKVTKPEPGYFTVDPARVSALRRARGFTQDELCKASGLGNQTVWRLESGWSRKDRGQAPPRGVLAGTLRKLADALNVDPSELTT